MNISDFQVGMVLISGNPEREAIIRSGILITDINENGLVVRRIHSCYLTEDGIESWTIRNHQIENMQWRPLPIGYQMPLL